MTFVKKFQIFLLLFLRQKEYRNNVLDKKESIWEYKNKNLSKLLKSHFSKGLAHDFRQKNPHFLFFLGQNEPRNNVLLCCG